LRASDNNTMAAPTSIIGLLESLTQSVTSALDVTPKIAALPQSEDGVSLLDVKNELLLSYLQNLVFLIILKLRAARSNVSKAQDTDPLADSVVRKLVELRLYLEKGTRPLEDKMRYQIDMLLRAASDAERKAQANVKKKTTADQGDSEDGGSASEASDADSEAEFLDDSEASDDEDAAPARPRLAALIAPSRGQSSAFEGGEPEPADGIYRAPKRVRQLMEDPNARRRDKEERRPQKSATLDEFVADELSTAPIAEPSIGTNVVARGRRVKTAAERAIEDERRNYEESNFVRLPSQTKKEKAKLKATQQGSRMVFGGEDFRDIGGQVERIDRLTRSKEGGRGNNVRAMLEKSRKRGRDGAGGGGEQIGERFQKKARVMEMGRTRRGKR
jgi:U3 small nucleolar ribonucleoprotein protein LCP5